jgi:hypothetical protein
VHALEHDGLGEAARADRAGEEDLTHASLSQRQEVTETAEGVSIHENDHDSLARVVRQRSDARVGLCLLVAALLPDGTALAQERPSDRRSRTPLTLVVAFDAPRDWGWEVRAALRRTGRVEPRTVPTSRQAPGGTGATDELQRALVDTERSFRQADFGACVQGASDAEQRLARPLAEARLLRQLSALVSLWAACELKGGAMEVARERASLALALDPDLALDPARFPPDVAELFDQARAARVTEALPVALRANLPDARFELDGREASGALALPIGTHYLVARARGARTAFRKLEVTEPGDLSLALEPADAELARSQIVPEARAQDLDDGHLRAVAIADGTSRILTVAETRPGRVEIVLRQVVGLEVSELGRAEGRAPGDAPGWSRLLGRVDEALEPPRGRAPPRTSGGNWWIWAAGAAVLVAAGTAVTIALLPEEPVDRLKFEAGGACVGGVCCVFPDCSAP